MIAFKILDLNCSLSLFFFLCFINMHVHVETCLYSSGLSPLCYDRMDGMHDISGVPGTALYFDFSLNLIFSGYAAAASSICSVLPVQA